MDVLNTEVPVCTVCTCAEVSLLWLAGYNYSSSPLGSWWAEDQQSSSSGGLANRLRGNPGQPLSGAHISSSRSTHACSLICMCSGGSISLGKLSVHLFLKETLTFLFPIPLTEHRGKVLIPTDKMESRRKYTVGQTRGGSDRAGLL